MLLMLFILFVFSQLFIINSQRLVHRTSNFAHPNMFEKNRLITLPDADLLFIENFYTPSVSDAFLAQLSAELAWEQGEITIFGKKIAEPRLSAWYGDAGKTYTYSGKVQEPLAWHDALISIKNSAEKVINSELNQHLSSVFNFNSVLCNYYRNGQDSMGFHSDNEKELGQNPTIASVNFGESRRFIFRRRDDKTIKHELVLTHGSLLVMSGAVQHHWVHAVPKEPKRTKPRINLTFRHIF
jgi:alkylated DNA repair dioxygenase AlkB